MLFCIGVVTLRHTFSLGSELFLFIDSPTSHSQGDTMKTKRPFNPLLLFTGILLFSISGAAAQPIVLVDFGAQPSLNTFSLAGWNTPLVSGNMEYTSEGPAGLRVASNADELTDFVGVQGSSRSFTRGERIVVTWYNASDNTISFTTRISFTDSDVPDGGTSTGNWYTMRRFMDYRETFTNIAPRAPAQTAFNIEETGVHKTDETFSLVNINLAIEWGSSDQKPFLVCDKIELMTDADIQAPAAPGGLSATPISDSKIQLQKYIPIATLIFECCNDINRIGKKEMRFYVLSFFCNSFVIRIR